MSYSVSYDPTKNIVRLDVESVVDISTAKSIATDSMKLAQVHSCKSVMVVFRDEKVAADTMSIYQFAKSLPELGFDPSIRVANVLPRHNPDHRFFETVAKNQGFEFRYFTDTASAEDWLSRGASNAGDARESQEKIGR
jgi:hypothetical protein